MTQITVTLDDQVKGERIQVNLDASLPVGQVLDALIQLRRLPVTRREEPISYDLIRVYNDERLRPDLSLMAQGVQPGEELILTERGFGLDDRSKLLLALGALGTLAVLCIAGVLLVTAFRASSPGSDAEQLTLTPDATLTTIAEATFAAGGGQLPPTSDLTPQPTLDTAAATPTDTGEVADDDKGCNDNLVFVADITIPDQSQIPAGDSFTKTWRVQNNGTCDWTSDYLFLFIDGAQMSGPNGQILGQTVPSGRQIDISVNFRAPDDPGEYVSYWQMQNAEGDRFGDVVFVDIIVPEPTPTPTITPTPVPDTTVTLTIDPAATVGPFDLVDITATTTNTVPVILIVAEGTDSEGEVVELATFTCENTDTCAVEFGGNDNTYAGDVTVTAYACAALSGCRATNVGTTSGAFVVNADIDTPSQLIVSSPGTLTAGDLVDIELLWSSVTDVDEYRYGYQLAGSSDRVEVGTTDNTTNTATFTIAGFDDSADYPITVWVEACNTFGCSEPAENTITAP
jgi:hypothetical protein